jgi:hypothetical protein
MYASSRIVSNNAGDMPVGALDAIVASVSTEWFESTRSFAAIDSILVLPTPPEMQSYRSRFVSRRPRRTEEKAERIDS